MRHKVHCLLIVLSGTGLLVAANPSAPKSAPSKTTDTGFALTFSRAGEDVRAVS